MEKQFCLDIGPIRSIIDRVQEQCPTISKTIVALVIKSFFRTIRKNLLAGNRIYAGSSFVNMRLCYYEQIRKNKISLRLRVKQSTGSRFS